jgi:hypothetical protein
MQDLGPRIIKSLLHGYVASKDIGLVLRGVEPRSVYISNDAKRINFSVMDSITRVDMNTKHPV